MHIGKQRKVTSKNKLRKGDGVLPAALCVKAGINKNSKPPKTTKPFKKGEAPPTLTAYQRRERIDYLQSLMVDGIFKKDAAPLFMEKYGLTYNTFEDWRDKARDKLQSDFDLAREEKVKFWIYQMKDTIKLAKASPKTLAVVPPLLKDRGEKMAKLGVDDDDKKGNHFYFNLAEIHAAANNATENSTDGKVQG